MLRIEPFFIFLLSFGIRSSEFVVLEIEDHEKGIAELEKKSEHADDPQVREWAAKTLPKMRQHLAKAKAVQETLKAEGDRKN